MKFIIKFVTVILIFVLVVSGIYTEYTNKINQDILRDANRDMIGASRYIKFRGDFQFGSSYYIRYSELIDFLHNTAEIKLIQISK